MGELYTNVVHQYAAVWEQLGLKLGLQHYDIANISKDNAHNPDRSVTCCRTVLEKWLQIVPSPNKLFPHLHGISWMMSLFP